MVMNQKNIYLCFDYFVHFPSLFCLNALIVMAISVVIVTVFYASFRCIAETEANNVCIFEVCSSCMATLIVLMSNFY
jgi:hypothetical protein